MSRVRLNSRGGGSHDLEGPVPRPGVVDRQIDDEWTMAVGRLVVNPGCHAVRSSHSARIGLG